VAVGLDGSTGLGRHHDHRALEVTGESVGDLGGIGGVQHDQRDARGPRDHLGGQRRATHSGEDDAVDALGVQIGAQRHEFGEQCTGRLVQRRPGEADARLGLGFRPPQGRVLRGQLARHRIRDQVSSDGADLVGVR
jgi:hypothetical protein